MKLRHVVNKHGYAGYTHGCRCDECTAGKREYMRAKRKTASARRERSPESGRYQAQGITHGTYAGYQDAHCRCYSCTAAKAEAHRKATR